MTVVPDSVRVNGPIFRATGTGTASVRYFGESHLETLTWTNNWWIWGADYELVTMTMTTSGVNQVWNLGVRGSGFKNWDFRGKHFWRPFLVINSKLRLPDKICHL